ncbi:hypothetical protein Trydic_g8156 [Trypoxylus dichotomus]
MSEAQTDIKEKILQLGRSLDGEGFADLDVQDIDKVINAHNAELSIEELCPQYEDTSVITQEKSEIIEVSCKDKLTIASLSMIIVMADHLTEEVCKMDDWQPNSKFRRALKCSLVPYKILLNKNGRKLHNQ